MVFSVSIHMFVSVCLHPKIPSDGCAQTQVHHIYEHIHRAMQLPYTTMLLTLVSGVT